MILKTQYMEFKKYFDGVFEVMKCPFCSSETKVIESRETNDLNAVRRRRECKDCQNRFTTYERPETHLRVVKKDDKREEFDREKIKRGILKACEKRPISNDEIDDIVDNVVSEIRKQNSTEVESSYIGKLIMDKLRELDKVAYIRFASVYRSFDDIDSFKEELSELVNEK